MKKLRILMLLILGGAYFENALGAQIPMHIIDEKPAGESGTYAPRRPWYITQDDYVLTLSAFEDDFTFEALDEDGMVVFATYLPAGTTQVILPSSLSGEFVLRFLPFSYTYYYRGYIVL